MKKFLTLAMAAKSVACIAFAGMIVLFMIIGMIRGENTLPFALIWQVLALAVVISIAQQLCFSGVVFKKLRYGIRMLIMSFIMLVVLAACAHFFEWFPAEPVNWLIFIGIFVLVIAAFTVSWEVYFRVTGKKYNDMLTSYQQRES